MTNIKKDIGKRIRIIRAEVKLTQEQFAKQLKVSPATVSGWELGDIGISIEAVIRISILFDKNLDWILKGSNELSNVEQNEVHTPEETRLFEAYQKLSKSSQSAILRVIEMMQK